MTTDSNQSINAHADRLFDGMSAWLTRSLQPLKVRITTLATRQDMLEARAVELGDTRSRSMVYRGVWRDDGDYQKGDTCTRDGSLWFCEAPTTTKPGTDATWRLTSKHGKSGERGPPGPKGDTPGHRWDGTALSFEKPDGGFGVAVDLKGDPGDSGGRTKMGLPIGIGIGGSTTRNSWYPAGW